MQGAGCKPSTTLGIYGIGQIYTVATIFLGPDLPGPLGWEPA